MNTSDSTARSEPVITSDEEPIATETVEQAQQPPVAGGLRCQWCSVALPADTTICPTCGSPGVPDPRLSVPEISIDEDEKEQPAVAAVFAAAGPRGEDGELVEWWRENPSGEPNALATRPQTSYQDVEDRQLRTIGITVGAVIVCVLLGWLIGPFLLEGLVEGLTGTPVEDRGDLRGMGAFMGFIGGMFIGAIAGTVIWAKR